MDTIESSRALVGALLACACACGPAVSSPGGDGDAGPGADGRPGSSELVDARPAVACNQIDLVFVIDDSISMTEEQANLAANFPAFIDVLDSYRNAAGAPLDYRVAVTTTGRDIQYTVDLGGTTLPRSSQGANGALLERAECGMQRRWLERGDANLASVFSCAAEVGTDGPTKEMPLLALEWAFSQRIADGTNAGFLRDDALLAAIVLTDEDDCSRPDDGFVETASYDPCAASVPELEPLARYVSFFDDLKGARGRWAFAAIAGPGPASCASPQFGDAAYADRLDAFVDQVGDNGVFSSICQGDLSTALGEALDTFQAACEQFPPIE